MIPHKIKTILDDFGIKVIINSKLSSRGRYSNGNEIMMRSCREPLWIWLHEIGHVLVGYHCCREHDEYLAHGAALALAKKYKIRFTEKEILQVDVYAGRSAHDVCGAIMRRREMKKENSIDVYQMVNELNKLSRSSKKKLFIENRDIVDNEVQCSRRPT